MNQAYVFDIDGVLFDTQEAVTHAYVQAGAEPDVVIAAWGKPWREWCEVEMHARKTRIYQKMIAAGEIESLPPLEIARELFARKELVVFLTGASYPTTRMLLRGVGMLHCLREWCANVERKKAIMQTMVNLDASLRVTYVDDLPLDMNVVPSGGCFIQYVGQDLSYLLEENEE